MIEKLHVSGKKNTFEWNNVIRVKGENEMNEIQQKQDYTSRIAMNVFASSEIVNSCFDIGEQKTDHISS